MRKLFIVVALVVTAAVAVVAASAVGNRGDNGNRKTRLHGYQEVPAKSTLGRGRFEIRNVNRSAKTFEWRLEYSQLEGGAVIGAHLHLGQRHTNGEIILPLCGAPRPPCPPSGTVTGTATNADIGATSAPPANQGIVRGEPTAFEELFRAIRAGAVYVNVHTTSHPGGEIRGQLGPGQGKGFGRGKNKDRD